MFGVELDDFHAAQVGFGKRQFLVDGACDGEDWFSGRGFGGDRRFC